MTTRLLEKHKSHGRMDIRWPNDVEKFSRDTREDHLQGCGTTYRLRRNGPPVSRGEFLAEAARWTEHEPIQIVVVDHFELGPEAERRECWVEPLLHADGESPARDAPGTPAPLTPVFSYRQWSITNPEEERPILRINFQEGRQLRVICPEPSCLSERYAPTTVGIVVETGENGKSSCLAVPCADHAGSFNFSDGWHRRFADARRQRQLETVGPPAPRNCQKCGNRYTSYLWGWPQDLCPECNYYEEYRFHHMDRLRTFSMEMGRRHGLGMKAMEYDSLPELLKERCLETLLEFIHQANRDRDGDGENPNGFRDLEAEYDRQHPPEALLAG